MLDVVAFDEGVSTIEPYCKLDVMPNGRPGDNPMTDLLAHGMHPFPEDMEALILEILARDQHALDRLDIAPFRWAHGQELAKGRRYLRDKLERLRSRDS